MTIDCQFRFGAVSILLLATSLPGVAQATDSNIASRTPAVDGLKPHYLIAGQGPAVILLHGYTQTSRMWRPIIPQLAKKFTVIAPDLPGIGDSDIPTDGLDMKNAAVGHWVLEENPKETTDALINFL